MMSTDVHAQIMPNEKKEEKKREALVGIISMKWRFPCGVRPRAAQNNGDKGYRVFHRGWNRHAPTSLQSAV